MLMISRKKKEIKLWKSPDHESNRMTNMEVPNYIADTKYMHFRPPNNIYSFNHSIEYQHMQNTYNNCLHHFKESEEQKDSNYNQ